VASGALLLNYRISHGASDKFARKQLIFLGLGLMTLAMILLTINAIFFKSGLIVLMLPMMLYLFGLGLCGSLFISEIMTLTQDKQGIGAVIVGFSVASAGACASFLVTVFYNNTILSIVMMMASVFLAAYLLVFLIYFFGRH